MKQKRRKRPWRLLSIEFFIQGKRYALAISKRFFIVKDITLYEQNNPLFMVPVKTDINVTGTWKEELVGRLQLLFRKKRKKIGKQPSQSGDSST